MLPFCSVRVTALRIGLTALMLPSVLPQVGAQSSHPIQTIITNHVERYPEMEPADLYKLLHQAAFGSEHAIKDTASAQAWLTAERIEMGVGPEEPRVDPLTPDSSLVRVHLRPFFDSGGDERSLLLAFIGTADAFAGSQDSLRRYWSVARTMLAEGRLPFDGVEMDTLFARMEAASFPAVHHSIAFVTTYRPAYRVVARRLLPSL